MSASLMIGIWLTAIIGTTLKLLLPGRFERFGIAPACCWAGAGSSLMSRSLQFSQASVFGCSWRAECCTRLAWCFIAGKACGFKMQFGTALCWLPPLATIWLFSIVQ